jgi:hypothetical protein
MDKRPRNCFKARKSASLVPRGIFLLSLASSVQTTACVAPLGEPHSGSTSEGSSPTIRVCADKEDGNNKVRYPLHTFLFS